MDMLICDVKPSSIALSSTISNYRSPLAQLVSHIPCSLKHCHLNQLASSATPPPLLGCDHDTSDAEIGCYGWGGGGGDADV